MLPAGPGAWRTAVAALPRAALTCAASAAPVRRHRPRGARWHGHPCLGRSAAVAMHAPSHHARALRSALELTLEEVLVHLAAVLLGDQHDGCACFVAFGRAELDSPVCKQESAAAELAGEVSADGDCAQGSNWPLRHRRRLPQHARARRKPAQACGWAAKEPRRLPALSDAYEIRLQPQAGAASPCGNPCHAVAATSGMRAPS